MGVKLSLKEVKKQENKRFNVLFIVFPLILVIFVLLIFYSLRTSSIDGKVLSSGDNKVILNNVTIKVNDKSYKNTQDGSFNIKGLKSNKYELSFEKEGYETSKREIVLNKGENLNLNVYLNELSKNNVLVSNNNFISLSKDNNKILWNDLNYFSKLSIKNALIANSKVYLNEQSSTLKVLDYNNGSEIKNIFLPTNFNIHKIYISNNKDKIFITSLNKNSIVVLKALTDEILNETQELENRVKKLLVTKDNRVIILDQNNNLYWLNVTNYTINKIDFNNSFTDIFLFRDKILLTQYNDLKIVDLTKNDLEKNLISYTLNFAPENILVTNSEKLYISSGKNLYLVDPETGNTNKTIDTGVNIVNMKVSTQDDNIYISDNTEKIHIFDTKNDELLKDSITFKMPVKEVFFPE